MVKHVCGFFDFRRNSWPTIAFKVVLLLALLFAAFNLSGMNI